jgi:hypothetical protein
MPTSSKNCSWVQQCIELYIDDELGGQELEAFERHIELCAICREELSRAGRIVNELRALPPRPCPESVMEKASVLAGAVQKPATTRFEWLRKLFCGRVLLAPKPVLTAVLIVVASAMLIVMQHERNTNRSTSARLVTDAVSQGELDIAKLDIMLAFLYVDKYTTRAGEIIEQEDIVNRMMKTIHKSVVKPVFSFPIYQQEEKI